MAHNLFGDRFYSLRRPAWHGLGNVLDQELGATKAFDLIGAASASTEKHRIVHDSRAEERMKLWLEHVYTKAVEKMNLMNRAFRAMADTPVTTADRDNVIEFVYTMPKMPIRAEMPETVYVEAVQTFEYQRERTLRRREAVREIFDGKGYGMDTPAARGTAWGLYNAVVEFSDYCGSGKGQAVAESALTGDRARDKEKAYGACAKLADKR